MKVLICGFGNMGKTFSNSFITSRYIKPEDLYALDNYIPAKEDQFGIPSSNFFTSPNADFSQFDILVLAVKPQDFLLLSEQIKEYISQDCIVLSIMAGIKINSIKTALSTNKIIRSMPNVPSQIGLGMTVFSASEEIDRKDIFIIQNLINTTGNSLFVEDEVLIDAATSISGSGPAYVFYFMQAMIDAAKDFGFNDSEAEFLVHHTFLGSVQLQNRSKVSNDEWIKRVSSKGGTSERAILEFEEKDTKNIIHTAMKKAFERAKELGN